MPRPYRSRRQKLRYREDPLEPWEYLALMSGPIKPGEYEHLEEIWKRWTPDPDLGTGWRAMTWAVETFGPPPRDRR